MKSTPLFDVLKNNVRNPQKDFFYIIFQKISHVPKSKACFSENNLFWKKYFHKNWYFKKYHSLFSSSVFKDFFQKRIFCGFRLLWKNCIFLNVPLVLKNICLWLSNVTFFRNCPFSECFVILMIFKLLSYLLFFQAVFRNRRIKRHNLPVEF